ncbi:hypothetical protein GTY65_24235 [Streptomyces sp. SID8379]|uniref:DUF6461 domain-containing protein n=1 Tax=unclassified Streptomyces TaxID=2593676 RepID=UPI0003664A86|nr:DUF6461 domain-containing protein [Streptomyces sp. HmicA12]MYW67152.1 hypothetical protein [Streptomyces sp. SID8379]
MAGANQWITDEWLAYCLVFSSEPDAQSLLLQLGCDGASIEQIDDTEEFDALLYQGMDEHDVWSAAFAGTSSDWAYCLVPLSGSPLNDARLRRASAQSSVICYASMGALCVFEYWENGRKLTGAELMAPQRRHGEEPDRLLAPMERAGCFDAEVGVDERGRALCFEITGVEIPLLVSDDVLFAGRMPALYRGSEGPSPYDEG